MKPEPLKNKVWSVEKEEIIKICLTRDVNKKYISQRQTKICFKKDIKTAVEWYKKYSGSGIELFKLDYPKEYLKYRKEGISKGWDVFSNESWNDWLLDKAFEDVMRDNKK